MKGRVCSIENGRCLSTEAFAAIPPWRGWRKRRYMDTENPFTLLGGLSPQQFMQRYWQKKPLLIRQAIPGFRPLLSRSELFALASQDTVESRLVVQEGKAPPGQEDWRLSHGPFQRRALPALSREQWTLLVQGVDMHHQAVHELLQRFRFVPDARLDDIMISYATEGGGVGPHFDSYDVFLLQAHGKRRWRIGRQSDLTLRDDLPMKILSNFDFEQEYVLEPGDMLYLPPRYAHDGVALDECMTYSVGFRVPEERRLAVDLMQLMVDEMLEDMEEGDVCEPSSDGASQAALPLPKTLYRDPRQPAVDEPAAIPAGLQAFAAKAVDRAFKKAQELPRLLGESMTEPKPSTWFQAGEVPDVLFEVSLARSTRMMYDAKHIFINGESYRAAGRDAALMRKLANERALGRRDLEAASADALTLLRDWCEAGWALGLAPGR